MMRLPFDEAQFFAVFAGYNSAFRPAVLALWFLTAALIAPWVAGRRVPSRWFVLLLVVHWLWAGVAYHLVWFTRINPAAYLFAALFVVEAGLLAWYGLYHGRLRFGFASRRWKAIASAFLLYALAYPFLGMAAGFRYPQMATFGVPCPTVLLTAGLLLATASAAPRLVLVIPFAWCIVGGSAAFLFGVYPDLALFLAALCLLVHATLAGVRSSAAPDGG